MPLRVAVIGCGFFGRFHLHAWRDLSGRDMQLVAVCDRDGDKAQAVAREFGLERWYADPASLMDSEERIDLLDVATRMDTHRGLVEAAMDRRIPTIVQKPLAPRWDDALAMVEASRRNGTFLAVHENFRFQTPMRRIREILESGEIGEASWARIALRTGFDVYRNQPYFFDEERLVILDLGIHLLDLARFFLGEADRVSCETQRRNAKVRAEDTATTMLRHRSGAVSVVECTYENRRSDTLETLVEIETANGGIVLEPAGRLVVTSAAGVRHEQLTAPVLTWAVPPFEFVQASVIATCQHMLECQLSGVDAETSGEDNLKTFALVEAAYEAAATGRAVAPLL